MKPKYQLILTEEQARLVSTCCEFFSRIMLGQFGEIPYHLMFTDKGENYCQRREDAERLLFEARKYIYPELQGRGHSYGIGKFDDADKAFDVHQVIREKMTPGQPQNYVFTYQEEIPEFHEIDQENGYVLEKHTDGLSWPLESTASLDDLVNAAAEFGAAHRGKLPKLRVRDARKTDPWIRR